MKVKVQRPNLRIHCHKARFSQRNRSLNYLVTWRSLQGIPGREMWRENTSLGQGYRVGRLYQRRALHVYGRPQLSPQLLPLCQAGLLTDRTCNPASLSFCQPPASSAPPWDPPLSSDSIPSPLFPHVVLSPQSVFFMIDFFSSKLQLFCSLMAPSQFWVSLGFTGMLPWAGTLLLAPRPAPSSFSCTSLTGEGPVPCTPLQPLLLLTARALGNVSWRLLSRSNRSLLHPPYSAPFLSQSCEKMYV